MTATLSPSPKQQFFDANGNPLVGGKLYSYVAGTTSPLVTYVDSEQVTTNTNPIILDSRGEANVWLSATSYKLKLVSATDVEIWTVDNIAGAGLADQQLVNQITATYAASNGSSLVGYLPAGTGAVATTVQTKLRESVSVTDFGAIADFGTTSAATNNAAINIALASFPAGGGILTIPKGVKWGPYSALTVPDEVEIQDYSGWDSYYSQWTAQIKIFLKTASPEDKNANEFQVISSYHPGIVIDNVGDGLIEKRSSVVFRYQGTSDWQFGPGIANDRILRIAYYGTYAGTSYSGGTNVWGIDQSDGSMFFNYKISGVDLSWGSVSDRTMVSRNTAYGTNGLETQWANVTTGLLLRQQISGSDGSWNWLNHTTSKTYGYTSANGEVWGNKLKINPKTNSYSITTTDTQQVFTNTGATGGFIFTLPSSVVGLTYDFYVTVAQNLRIQPQAGDAFRGYTDGGAVSTKVAGKYMESGAALVGAVCHLRCVVAGVWEYERRSAWTDQP